MSVVDANVVFSKALVLFQHGTGWCLCSETDIHVGQFIADVGGHGGDGFSFEKCGVVVAETLTDGLYIGELRLIDDGPGDAPGSRECALEFRNAALASANAWRLYTEEGEWPW